MARKFLMEGSVVERCFSFFFFFQIFFCVSLLNTISAKVTMRTILPIRFLASGEMGDRRWEMGDGRGQNGEKSNSKHLCDWSTQRLRPEHRPPSYPEWGTPAIVDVRVGR